MIATLRRLDALAPAPRGRLLLSVALGTLAVVAGIGLMATAGYLISRAAERPAILSLTVAIVAVRFFALARPLARYLERLASHDLAFRVLARTRVRFYERIEPLAPAGIEAYRRGDLVNRMVGDVDALQSLYLRGLGPPLVAAAAGAVAIGTAAAILLVAAAVLAAGLLAAGVAVPALAGWLVARSGRARSAAQGALAAELVELLRAAPELAVYGREDETLARVRGTDRTLARIARRDALAAGAADALAVVATGATLVCVVSVAASSNAAGDLDRVLVAALALLTLSSFEAVAPMSVAARELSAALASGARVLELTDREPLVTDPAEPARPPSGVPAVALEDVRAGYAPGRPPVLDGARLTLEPGQKLALVGPSGSGKTTVVNLLLRFLDPDEGRVTLAGRDLRELRQEDVRRTIAVASQDAHLFSTTVRENVRLARPDASDDEIAEALRRARVWDWVAALPEGLDTLVGEEGTEVSGGQRQRIALARALLVDAPVLVLDEPTAHLDAETAESLVSDILSAAGDRSVLLVTHRPEGLNLVDEVRMLSDGRIAANGAVPRAYKPRP